MKEFPKKIYVSATVDEDDNIDGYYVYENVSVVELEEEESEIAVYELVKVGHAKKTVKVVFE